jgi:hypothetical protein
MTRDALTVRRFPSPSLLAAASLLCACAGSKPTPTAVDPAVQANAKPAAAAEPVAAQSQPAPQTQTTQDAALQKRFVLENRLDVVALRHAPDVTQSAELALLLPGGSETSRPGSAELAAHLLAHAADATSGRQSLARQLERMGGVLTFDIGRKSTWVHVRVPQSAWQRAAQALANALDAKTSARSQLERSQEEVVAHETAAIAADSVRVAATRLVLGIESPAAHLQNLSERDAGEALAFQQRYFRPDRAVLVLRTQLTDAQIETAVRASFGTWEPGNPTPEGEITTKVRPAPRGIAWMEDPKAAKDSPCDAALLLPWPDALAPDAAALHMFANATTIEGVGGRLERLMQEAGLGKVELRAETLRCGEGTALLLRGTMTSQQALQLHATAIAARQSLRDIPLSSSERTQARAAAWLSMRESEASASSRLRNELERILLDTDAAAQMRQLAALEMPTASDLKALNAFLEMPVAMVVRGGPAPAGAADVRPCPTTLAAAAIPIAGAADEAMRAAALPWRTRAIEALGGEKALAELDGFTATRRVATVDAPEIEETTTWKRSGDVMRVRKALGATVETTLAGSKWTETANGKAAQLSPQEAAWRRAEAASHPLAIVLAWQRGDLQFRLLTSRNVGDRVYETLEEIGDQFERLRIELDRESALVRTVEHWATTPEGSATRAVETWADYRTIEGIRAPFRCTTVVDDGQSERTSVYSKFAPLHL